MYRTWLALVVTKPTGPITVTRSVDRRYVFTPRLGGGDGGVSKKLQRRESWRKGGARYI